MRISRRPYRRPLLNRLTLLAAVLPLSRTVSASALGAAGVADGLCSKVVFDKVLALERRPLRWRAGPGEPALEIELPLEPGTHAATDAARLGRVAILYRLRKAPCLTCQRRDPALTRLGVVSSPSRRDLLRLLVHHMGREEAAPKAARRAMSMPGHAKSRRTSGWTPSSSRLRAR